MLYTELSKWELIIINLSIFQGIINNWSILVKNASFFLFLSLFLSFLCFSLSLSLFSFCLSFSLFLSSFPPSIEKKAECLEDYYIISICIFRSYWYIGVCVSIWVCMCSDWKTDQRIEFFTHFTCFAICSAFTQPFSGNMWVQNREKWEDPRLVSNSTIDLGCPTSQTDYLKRFHGEKRICDDKLH